MKRISFASTHDPICVEKGGEENTLKYSYLQITVCMSPCRLRGGAAYAAAGSVAATTPRGLRPLLNPPLLTPLEAIFAPPSTLAD